MQLVAIQTLVSHLPCGCLILLLTLARGQLLGNLLVINFVLHFCVNSCLLLKILKLSLTLVDTQFPTCIHAVVARNLYMFNMQDLVGKHSD